ncbi:MAG: hypothetical protein WAL27_20215 [Cellulosimicrobium cellulans]
MNYDAGNGPVRHRSDSPRDFVIPTESLVKLRRTLRLSDDVIDLHDAKQLLELVEEELALRASQGEAVGPFE